MNNNTRPELRTNKLGHVVTKHVKDGSDEKKPSASLSQAAPRLTSSERNRNAAETFIHAAQENMDDPSKVLDNLQNYQNLITKIDGNGVARRDVREAAIHSLRGDRVIPRLREAFLKSITGDVTDPSNAAEIQNFSTSVMNLVALTRAAERKLYRKEPVGYFDTRGDVIAATVPEKVDWEKLSPGDAQSMLLGIDKTLDDSSKLWRNLDLLTDALRSPNAGEALDYAVNSGAVRRISDTWIAMHGADKADARTYKDIGGPEGYEAYVAKYNGQFSRAVNEAFLLSDFNPFPEEA